MLRKSINKAKVQHIQFFKPSLNYHYSTNVWEMPPPPNLNQVMKGYGKLNPNDEFTIFNPRFVYFNEKGIDGFREKFSVIGADTHAKQKQGYLSPAKLCVFKASRKFIHITILQLLTTYQMLKPEEYIDIINELKNNESIKELISRLDDQTPNLHNRHIYQETALLKQNINGGQIAQNSTHKIYRLISQGNLIDKNKLIELAAEIDADLYINKYIKTKIFDKVSQELPVITKKKGLIPLTMNGKDKRTEIKLIDSEPRLTLMVAGGPASGKTTITEQIFEALREKKKNPRDFSIIAPDFIKSILGTEGLEKADLLYHGTLLQPECSFLCEQQIEDITSQLKKTGKGPNTFIEMAHPYPDKVELGTLNKSSFTVYVTSYNPIQAINGSFERYQDINSSDKGRFVFKEHVLEGHKNVSKYIPTFIKEYQGKFDKRISLEIHHMEKANERKLVAQPIALFDPAGLVIFDIQNMFEFIKKEYINTTANKPEEIFNSPEIEIENLAIKFKKAYVQEAQVEVLFAERDMNNYLNIVPYAKFSHIDGVLNVYIQEIFDKKLKSDECFEKVIRVLLENEQFPAAKESLK